MPRDFTLIDLFAGAGGMSTGFEQAGFTPLAANDFDSHSAITYRLNNPDVNFIDGSIQDISAQQLMGAAGIDRGELDVLIGGPPCQAYSVYNHQRGMHDERSGLFREYLRIVKGVMPKFVVIENVTGITSIANGTAVKEIYQSLGNLGYHVEHRTLKAEEFGVPQERRRIFFIGSLNKQPFEWPEPVCQLANSTPTLLSKRLARCVNVWDAIGDLPELQILEGEEDTKYTCRPKSGFQKLMRKDSERLFNHVAPYLAPINLERLKYIPQGGSWRDIPLALLPAGMKLAKRSDHTKRYGRLHPEGLASTILTKCDLHWGAFIHPTQERGLTVREAARLQAFPDKIRFTGPRSEQYRQVGNAVPPLLAKAIGEAIGKMLALKKRSKSVRSYCAV
jgi:DNA (cytosine-5)-methyltransferase 1